MEGRESIVKFNVIKNFLDICFFFWFFCVVGWGRRLVLIIELKVVLFVGLGYLIVGVRFFSLFFFLV